jgi:hypothetical protein
LTAHSLFFIVICPETALLQHFQLAEKVFFLGLLKSVQMLGHEGLRSESYLMYVATTKAEGNAADGRFSATR